jgi:hypothetical protein
MNSLNLANVAGAYPLPPRYLDDTLDEIYAPHILEHFSYREAWDVVRHWVAKLKVGGVLKIAVPDFEKIIKNYQEGTDKKTLHYLMGGQLEDGDFHKSAWDRESLTHYMTEAGLVDLKDWKSEIQDCAALPISLNIQGVKADPAKKFEFKGRVEAVMSIGRLAFTNNYATAIDSLGPLGIKLTLSFGIFWGQVLTCAIEEAIEKGAEYILTLDYDTWFNKGHVLRLLHLMQSNPDVDAVVPVQIKREDELAMFGILDEHGKPTTTADLERFLNPLTPIATGHFGLTLIRASAFEKLKKPWFMPQPAPDGGWGEGRVDEDIFFWNNFRESGCRAALANDVSIGHLQLMCTFPGLPKDNWKPIHVYISEINKEGVPDHCKPPAVLIGG